MVEEVHEDKVHIPDPKDLENVDEDESQGDNNMTFDEFKQEFG